MQLFWCTLFFTYYEFRHTALSAYCFFLRISWIRTYCSFDVLSFSHMLWIRTYCFFLPRIMNFFGHTALMENCFFHILWIWTYCSYGELFFHILWIWTYCSFLVQILWMQTYCYFSVLLISWTYCSFGILLFHMLWILTYCFFHALWIFGHIVLLVYSFSHIMNSDILLFWTQHQISLDSAI